MLLTLARLAALVTATCLLTSCSPVAAAAHGQYSPARRYAPTEVEPVATPGAGYEEAKGNERREVRTIHISYPIARFTAELLTFVLQSGGNKIYSVQYCTDPHFTGQCAMPEVTLEDCMVIADATFMNSISSFRTNDDCVYCEREWRVQVALWIAGLPSLMHADGMCMAVASVIVYKYVPMT